MPEGGGVGSGFQVPQMTGVLQTLCRATALLAVEEMTSFVRWLANLKIKRNLTSMFETENA